MVLRRRLALAGVAFAIAIAGVGVACSFPDVEFAPQDEASVIAPEVEPDANEGPVVDAGPVDSSTVDVAVRGDSGIITREECANRPLCDCDLDGYLEIGCDAGAEAGSLPGGDCDDLDPFRHPGQIFTTEAPTGDGGWDWNCSGQVEKAYQENPACTGGLLTPCGGEGFQSTVACGQTGEFYRCIADRLLGCSLTSYVEPRVQPCK